MAAPVDIPAGGRPARTAGLEIRRPVSRVSPLGTWPMREPAAWRVGDALLAVGLIVGLMVASNLSNMPRGIEEFMATRISIKNVLLLAAFAWTWPRVLGLCGLYASSRLRSGKGEWPRLALAGAIGAGLALVFPLTSQSGLVTPWHALAFGAIIAPAAGLIRAGERALTRGRVRAPQRQVILVGSGALARRMYHQLMADPLHHTVVLGFVDAGPHLAMAELGLEHLGTVQNLEKILMHRVVDEVFVGLPVKSRYDEILQSIAACARVGVRASYSGDLFGGGGTTSHADVLTAPVLSLSHTPRADQLVIKRVMDVVGSAVLLVVLAPVMAGVAIAIKLTSPGPVLFSQDRYGYMKRRFRMYKFRTMTADAEQLHADLEKLNEATGPIFKIRNDPRITPIGRFLRRSSLDELPQLWHVLTGEMALVGPRPMATRDVALFPEPWLMRRFSMRPGLTCLWQIGGRSDLSFDRWIALDLEYIDNWSLWLDMQILLRTLPVLIRGTGAM